MLNRSLYISIAAAMLVTAAPGFESEAAAAMLTTRIPASACSPETPDDDASLELSNGSWIFSGTETGTMTLWCPVVTDRPWSALDPYTIDVLRLWYRDPDGTSSGSRVTAELFSRPVNSSTATSRTSVIDSNSSSVTSSNTLWTSVSETSADVLFFVKVTISRNSGSSTVAFHGVDLPQAPAG